MYDTDLLRISFSLLAIVVFIIISGWLAKRSQQLRSSRKKPLITVLDKQSLGPRMQVVLIESQGQKLLLGVTPQQINLLHRLEASNTTPDSFQQHLQQHYHEPSSPIPTAVR